MAESFTSLEVEIERAWLALGSARRESLGVLPRQGWIRWVADNLDNPGQPI